MKLVTAIITTHNRLELLKRAIDSVFTQTYKNIELIVVDDASTDGTSEYCKNRPIQYIYIPKAESKGGNYARNQGIRAAKGEYIAFLDDDDYWLPAKIEKQVALLEQKDCELVHCGRKLEIIDNGKTHYRDLLPNPLEQGDMHKKILMTICTTTTNILAKKQALIEVGLFDENLRFWQEYELTIRLAQRKPFYFVNEALSVYRIDHTDKNRLTNKYDQWKDAVNYIHKKHANLYKQLNLFERLKVHLLIMLDASVRCKNANLKWKHYQIHVSWWLLSLPFRIADKIRYIFKYKFAHETL